MNLRIASLATPVAALALLAACGSGDDNGNAGNGGGDNGAGAQAGGAGRCVDSWNKASADVRAQASLSHRGEGSEPDVPVGSYTGKAFTATGESYDSSGSSTSADVAVAPGDCVAVDLTGSGDSETNWVMVDVRGGGGTAPGWYFLDETGSHPLTEVPQPLGEPVRAGLVGFGQEAKLQPDGP